jgi:hypothetical protein
MADDLATLSAQRDRLIEIRTKGVRSYEIASGSGSRRLEYRSDAEVAAALADVERRIAALQGRRVSTVYINASKGT